MKFQKIIEEIFMNNNKNNITEKRLQELIDACWHGGNDHKVNDTVDEIGLALKQFQFLRKSVELALELSIGYDGFDTIDGLKSLIDDIGDVLRGDHKWEDVN